MKKIHISIGDPGGIGAEIVVKALKNLKELSHIFVIHCDLEVLKKSSKQNIDFIDGEFNSSTNKAGIYIKNINSSKEFFIGKVDKSNGEISARSIISAAKLCGKDDFLVTAPINKEALNLAGYNFQGHTEMLGDLTNSKEVFMSFWGGINTLLLTTHISLKEMITKVSDEEYLYNKILNSHKFIRKILKKNFKPVIAGLNPHAGENGLMGDEEIIIKKVLKRLEEKNIFIDGPLPPDTIFATYLTGKYNFVYSLYHDQALIPVKTFFMDRTLNMTLGLPFIRVSPDHGTAFDIAGKNIADYKAMDFCFEFIDQI